MTPSCDDAFLGIIAVYSGAKLYAETMGVNTSKFLREWMALPDIKNLPPFYRTLSNRTTDVSLKYLCCAQEGRFSDVVIDLIKGMFSKAKDLRDYITVFAGGSWFGYAVWYECRMSRVGKSIN